MKKSALTVFGCLYLLTGAAVCAQENSTTTSPPKVLTVFREFLKPGKSGPVHENSEIAFVQALRHADSPTHYLAADSLSGKTRSVFLTGYDSFEAWEKDVQSTQANPALSATLARANVRDGDLLSDTDSSAWVLNPDNSLNPNVDAPHMRYLDIEVFQVKAGHESDWDEIMKLVITGYQQIPDTHWAAYDNVYGASSNTHAFFMAMKSAREIDHNLATNKDFVRALGADGVKKLANLSAAAIDSIEDNLFVFSPRMSYVSDDWIKADPEFWNPKTPVAARNKAAKGKSTKTQ
jgi:hypothetical protein